MKKFKFNKISIVVLAVAFTLGLGGSVAVFALGGLAEPVDLGVIDSFAVLAGAAVNDTNLSVINGDVGLSPAGWGASALTCGEVVTGTIYSVDGSGPAPCVIHDADDATLTPAQAALTTAYGLAAGQPTTDVLDTTELGGRTLPAGVYVSGATTFGITAGETLTLDGNGNPDAVFIFNMASDAASLVTGANSNVELIDGAQACNVFWRVGGSAVLGTETNFVGTIMADQSITDNGGSTVEGRFLARIAAVTLNNTHITVSTCAPPILHLQKTMDKDNGGVETVANFTLTAEGTIEANEFSGTSPVDSDEDLLADTFTLSETNPGEYTASAWVCEGDGIWDEGVDDEITLAAGEEATCTITNSDNAPKLTLIKKLVGGSDDEAAWILTAEGPTRFEGAGPEVVSDASFDIGTYNLSEDGPGGYGASDWVCEGDVVQDDEDTVTLALGDEEVCTITNTAPVVHHSSVSGSIARVVVPVFQPSITILSTPVVIVPKLPKTGFAPQENGAWYESLLNNILDLFR